MKRLSCALVMGVMLVAGAANATDHQVIIKNHIYMPDNVVIKPGDSVTWVNHDEDPHNVIDQANKKQFHSPALDTNDTYSYTFTKAGSYAYFCTFHPTMQAKVTVK